MILFFMGFYYMYQYVVTKEYNLFLFSCLMYGLATFIRLDTLVFIAIFAITTQPFQRRNRGGKNGIQLGALAVPVRLQGGQCKIRFRIEEIIETPLFDARLVANLVDGRGAIRSVPD